MSPYMCVYIFVVDMEDACVLYGQFEDSDNKHGHHQVYKLYAMNYYHMMHCFI